MADCEIPVLPYSEANRPAPSVTVNNVTSYNLFDGLTFTVASVSSSPTKLVKTLSLLDSEGVPTGLTPVYARLWLVDGAKNPSTNLDHTFNLCIEPLDTSPDGTCMDIAFIAGEYELTLEHVGSQRSVFVMVQLGVVIVELGEFIIGA